MRRCVVLIPAGGTGRRFGGPLPKQFTLLAGRPVLHHALAPFLAEPRVEATYLALSPAMAQDPGGLPWPMGVQVLGCGAATRAQTVARGLEVIAADHPPDTWVLVHDGVRPGLSSAALTRLLDQLWDDPVGGLLALPVADTLKRASPGSRVSGTVDRTGLWAAQTPQMFPLGVLRVALGQAREATDEASAIEALGQAPRLVPGEPGNFKITTPADLELAAALLAARDAPRATQEVHP